MGKNIFQLIEKGNVIKETSVIIDEFIPLVKLITTKNQNNYDLIHTEEHINLSKHIDKNKRNPNLQQITTDKQELLLSFKIEKGIDYDWLSYFVDDDGYIEPKLSISDEGVKIVSETKLLKKFGDELEVKLKFDAKEKKEFYLDCYANDDEDDFNKGEYENVHCGRVKVVFEGVGILEEMKKLVDKHIIYSQIGVRDSLSEEGLKNLDCSETVAIYLYKLGVMPELKSLYTGSMITQRKFRKAIGSNNIKFVKGSDKSDFKPQKGDIFVWRRSDGVGHTGIIYKYDEESDLVTVLEAIGRVGSADEKTNKNKGGYKGTNCSRTAVYKRKGKALCLHTGWRGYFRPINYTKKL